MEHITPWRRDMDLEKYQHSETGGAGNVTVEKHATHQMVRQNY